MNKKIANEIAMGIILLFVASLSIAFWIKKDQSQISNNQVAKTQPQQDNQEADIAETQNANKIQNANKTFIEIRELGFKIPISPEVAKEITYKIGLKDEFNDFSKVVYFSSKDLNAKFKSCANWPGIHQIEKISGKPTDEKNKVYEIGYDLPGGNKNKIVREGVIKQFDSFYLFANYNHPQSSCSDLKANDVENNLIKTINTGLKDAVLITN